MHACWQMIKLFARLFRLDSHLTQQGASCGVIFEICVVQHMHMMHVDAILGELLFLRSKLGLGLHQLNFQMARWQYTVPHSCLHLTRLTASQIVNHKL